MSTLASLLPMLREVALDATGAPMGGALLYSYAAGTSTPLATYSDSALTTPNTNPVVANAGGLFPAIYLSNAAYKFDLQSSAAVSLFTQDNVYPPAYLATTAVAPVIQSSTSIGTQNDFALTTGVTLLRMNNASLVTVTGFSAGVDGQRVRIVSIGAGQVDLVHQSSGSVAANRLINVATSGNTSLAAGSGTADYVYDATTARWRLVSHEQGAWITRTFAAGNYTGSAGTWAVASGNVSVDAYRLQGKTLSMAESLSGSTSTTPGTQYKVLIPGGFTAARPTNTGAQVTDNGTNVAGLLDVATSATTVSFFRADLANYTAGSANVAVRGSISFEVQ